MKYSDWPEEKIEISKLKLDPFNPRFPYERSSKTQEEIRQELVENYDVEFIASLISFYGYFPTESLIAFKEKGNIYVLEGNRRLAACQLLLNPKSSPFGYEAKFTTLSKEMSDKEDIKKIKVVFAPDRDSAIPILLNKHTRTSARDWVPSMKNKFYVDLLERYSAEDLEKKFKIKTSEINKSVVVDDLYTAAKRLDYDEEISVIVHDEKKFPVSTLARVFTSTSGKKYYKSSIVDGKVHIVSDPASFYKAFKTLVVKLADESLNSRALNSNELIQKELGKFRKAGVDEPVATMTEALTLEEAYKKIHKPTKKAATKKAAAKKSTRRKPTTIGLLPVDFECNSSNQRLNDVCEELQLIDVSKSPNATSVLLRLFLELATYNYLNNSGELKKMEVKAKAGGSKLPPTFPELRKMLKWIVSNNLLGNTQVTKALDLFTQDSNQPILAQLNQYVHNFAYHPDEKDLRHIWRSLSEYFKIVLK